MCAFVRILVSIRRFWISSSILKEEWTDSMYLPDVAERDTMKREIFTQMLWGMVSSLVLVTEREKEDVIYLRHTSWTLWWARLLLGSPSQMSGGSHWGNLVFQAWQNSWKFDLSCIIRSKLQNYFISLNIWFILKSGIEYFKLSCLF